MSIKIPKYPCINKNRPDFSFRALAQNVDEKEMEGDTEE